MWLKDVERSMYSMWIEYEEADAERKRQILVSLRDAYLALPECDQETLHEIWWRWLKRLEREGKITVRDYTVRRRYAIAQ
jgi:hypothetical protein